MYKSQNMSCRNYCIIYMFPSHEIQAINLESRFYFINKSLSYRHTVHMHLSQTRDSDLPLYVIYVVIQKKEGQ
jgi:hypothetical protein